MDTFINFLHQSNSNGISTIIFGVLCYLSLYHFFIFLQNKKTHYLFYSVFALFNAFQLFGLIENIFFESFFERINFRNSPMFYNFKTVSFMFFALFIMSITNTQKENPKFYKQNLISIYITFGLVFLAIVFDYSLGTQFSRYIFQFILFPVFTIITIMAIPLMLKFDSSIKYYLIAGFVIYNILNGILFVIQLQKNITQENNYLFLFYISILVENMSFTLALGKRENEIQLEKNKAQQNYINQLQENRTIKENLNIELAKKIDIKTKELKEITKQHLKEKEDKLKIQFENEKQRIQMMSLQYQMNPHFIFNALNSIKAYLIKNDIKNGIFYIDKFAKLMRGILDGLRNEVISLENELKLLDTYTKIEGVRMKEQIEFEFKNNTSLSLDTVYLPPLILQPLIENAIHHGFPHKIGAKKIEIILSQKADFFEFEIIDNGIGMTASNELKKDQKKLTKSYGLSLVKERLASFNKNNNDSFIETRDVYDKNKCLGTHVSLYLTAKGKP